MSERFSTSLGIATALILALSTIAFSQHVVAQTTCQNGLIPAPAGDSVFGIASGTCVNTSLQTQLQGGCSFNPYTVLQQFVTGSNIVITPQAGTTGSSGLQNGINPSLACRLAQFLQYAQAQGHPLKIVSGYRSAQTQANTCQSICGNPNGCTAKQGGNCGAPGNSCHQYGLAVDLSGTGLAWAQQYLGLGSPSSGSQQFKLFFPIKSDGGHLQCTEDTVGACSVNSNPCGGTAGINPNLNYTATPQTPTSGISNAVRSVFSPQTTASYAQPTSVTPLTSSPVTSTSGGTSVASTQTPTSACTPQYICSNNTVYYQSDSCSTSVFQVCKYGCSGTVCTPAPTSSSTNVQAYPTATTSVQADNLLQQLITSTAATSVSVASTNTAVSLNTSIYTIVQGEVASQTVPTTATSSFVGSSNYIEQTFSGNSNTQTTYTNSSGSQLSQLLFTMQTALGDLLTYLQPFGGRLPA